MCARTQWLLITTSLLRTWQLCLGRVRYPGASDKQTFWEGRNHTLLREKGEMMGVPYIIFLHIEHYERPMP